MRSLICLITLILLAFPQNRAVAHGSGYGGGGHGYGGYSCYGGYHGGGCYGGYAYCGGYHGYGGCYGYFPFYVSLSYAPYYYYYPSYSVVYSSSPYNSIGSYPPDYAPAAPPTGPGYSTTVHTTSTSMPPTASTSAPMGKLDDFGYVHSPYSTSTFKVENVADGQTFHDPITGQSFQVRTSKAPAASATQGFIPTGKLDEFGYVHSPYSTFTFKVQNSNYAQVFHDPLTGQPFVVAVRPGTPAPVLASAKTTD